VRLEVPPSWNRVTICSERPGKLGTPAVRESESPVARYPDWNGPDLVAWVRLIDEKGQAHAGDPHMLVASVKSLGGNMSQASSLPFHSTALGIVRTLNNETEGVLLPPHDVAWRRNVALSHDSSPMRGFASDGTLLLAAPSAAVEIPKSDPDASAALALTSARDPDASAALALTSVRDPDASAALALTSARLNSGMVLCCSGWAQSFGFELDRMNGFVFRPREESEERARVPGMLRCSFSIMGPNSFLPNLRRSVDVHVVVHGTAPESYGSKFSGWFYVVKASSARPSCARPLSDLQLAAARRYQSMCEQLCPLHF
jgi:hypothetical protein